MTKQDLTEKLQRILKSASEAPKLKDEEQVKEQDNNLQIFMSLDDYIEENAVILEQSERVKKKLAIEAFPDLWSETSKTHEEDVYSKVSSLSPGRAARLYAGLLFHDYKKRTEDLHKKAKESLKE